MPETPRDNEFFKIFNDRFEANVRLDGSRGLVGDVMLLLGGGLELICLVSTVIDLGSAVRVVWRRITGISSKVISTHSEE
jgi:hypothetical protein